MEKTKVCIWLDSDLHTYLNEARGEELTIPQYIRLILKQKMKNANRKKPKTKATYDLFNSPLLAPQFIPDDLKDYSDLLLEWWAIRYKNKATCSQSVAERIFKKLRTFPPQDKKVALEKAIAGGWKDIYEIKQSYKPEEPKNNHPASRVFTAERGFE